MTSLDDVLSMLDEIERLQAPGSRKLSRDLVYKADAWDRSDADPAPETSAAQSCCGRSWSTSLTWGQRFSRPHPRRAAMEATMTRKHPTCFVCLKKLKGHRRRYTMRMTWADLPGHPEIGMHWPECGDDSDPLWLELKEQIMGDPDGNPIDVPRERLEAFLDGIAERDPRCLVRNKR